MHQDQSPEPSSRPRTSRFRRTGRRGVMVSLACAALITLGACGSDDDAGANGGSGGSGDAPAGEGVHPDNDGPVVITRSGYGPFKSRGGGWMSGAGAVLENSGDEPASDLIVTFEWFDADGASVGSTTAKVTGIDPGATGHAGTPSHNLTGTPASMEVTVEAAPDARTGQSVPIEVGELTRDEGANLNNITATLTNDSDADLMVAVWCVVEADGVIVAGAQNSLVTATAGGDTEITVTGGGPAGDSTECSASSLAP